MHTLTESSDLTTQMHRRGVQRVSMQLGILTDAGVPVGEGASILDLGCGNGDLVAEYRRRGFRAFGCDFAYKTGPQVDELSRKGYIRLIEREPYRLPFDDQQFDVVVSNEVFEHVRDYDGTLAEHRRVLKRGGVGLHSIPSRYSPIEGHVYVPLATIVQDYRWLRFWAQLGVRTPAQKGMSAEERARRNHAYLTSSTNYLTKSQMRDAFARYFDEVRFVEELFLKRSRRARILYDLTAVLPFIPATYSALRSRVVLCGTPHTRESKLSE